MFNRLLNFIKYGNRKIIQFSPVRSGSTVVFNILKDLFPRHQIIKSHSLDNELANKYPVITTYRHPLDSLASTFHVLELTLSDDELKIQVEKHRKRGFDDLVNVWDHPNILKLRYEDFVDDLGTVLSAIEEFMGIEVSPEKKAILIEKYQIGKIEKMVAQYRNFKEFDKNTHWHGKHISKHKGMVGYHKDFFTPHQLEYLNKEFSKYLKTFGYD